MEGTLNLGIETAFTVLMVALLAGIAWNLLSTGESYASAWQETAYNAQDSMDTGEILDLKKYSGDMPVTTIYNVLKKYNTRINKVSGQLISNYLDKDSSGNTVKTKVTSEFTFNKDSGGNIFYRKWYIDKTGNATEIKPLPDNPKNIDINGNNTILVGLETLKDSFMGRAKIAIKDRDDGLYDIIITGTV